MRPVLLLALASLLLASHPAAARTSRASRAAVREAALVSQAVRDACLVVHSRTGGDRAPLGAASGTGFLVAPDLVLTCLHMASIPTPDGRLASADSLTVEAAPGDFVRAGIVARDEEHDLALLRLARQLDAHCLTVSDFSVAEGEAVTVFGLLSESLKTAGGRVTDEEVMDGFAMASAKVRSGFSGGPVIDSRGRVQGMLSQRDDDNNAVFVRADVIARLLRRYEKRSGRDLAAEAAAGVPAEKSAPVLRGPAPRRDVALAGTVDDAGANAATGEIVVAVPVRRSPSGIGQ